MIMKSIKGFIWATMVVVLGLTLTLTAAAQTIQVKPTVETDPVVSSGNAANDSCVWIHPTDPSQSTILGTDKKAGLIVYDLAGHQIQHLSDIRPNNVDIRYNFPLGPTFPFGVFVAQDNSNSPGNQNFKLVPWEGIAKKAVPVLAMDPTWDPRAVGAEGSTD